MFVANSLLAQQTPPFTSTKNKKAEKFFGQGLQYYTGGDLGGAIDFFEKAIKEDTKFIDAYWMRAEAHYQLGEDSDCVNLYQALLKLNVDYPLSYFGNARIEAARQQYEQAKTNLDRFFTYPDFYGYKNRAEALRKNVDFAVEAIKSPVRFEPFNLGKNVNSVFDEYFPGITQDGQTLIFTRQLGDYISPNEDFFVCKRESNQWAVAKPLGDPINTADNEGTVSLSTDGQYVFFTKCNNEQGRKSNCDLFLCRLDGDRWTEPVNLGPVLNTPYWESQPSVSFNGKTLYFTSNRPGGYGGSDLWSSTYNKGRWTPPVNMGPEINTTSDEQCPYIAADDHTLYFISEGHPGMGKGDIYVCRRSADGRWQKPQNLGYPINTASDERGMVVSADGSIAYISMQRAGGLGGLDIYGFELPENVRPAKTGYVKGIVFDALSKAKLAAHVELIDLASGKTVVESYSNKLSGEFLVSLQGNRDYALNVSCDGYLFYSENFSLKNQSNTEPLLLNVPLQPIKAGSRVVLKNVFFDTDKYNLKDESKIELDKLVQFLIQNPAVKIELSGHTDNVGGKAKNQPLSANRAKAVYDFLIAKGIAATRLSHKGYADTEPVADNKTEAGRSQNRRTEFRILP